MAIVGRNLQVMLLLLASAIPSAAQSIPEGCIKLGAPKRVAGMCDFKSGLGIYYTHIETVPKEGCPKQIAVEFIDPQNGEIEGYIAGRRGSNMNQIQTCVAGVTQVRVKGSKNGLSAKDPTDKGPSRNRSSKAITLLASDGGTMSLFVEQDGIEMGEYTFRGKTYPGKQFIPWGASSHSIGTMQEKCSAKRYKNKVVWSCRGDGKSGDCTVTYMTQNTVNVDENGRCIGASGGYTKLLNVCPNRTYDAAAKSMRVVGCE